LTVDLSHEWSSVAKAIVSSIMFVLRGVVEGTINVMKCVIERRLRGHKSKYFINAIHNRYKSITISQRRNYIL